MGDIPQVNLTADAITNPSMALVDVLFAGELGKAAGVYRDDLKNALFDGRATLHRITPDRGWVILGVYVDEVEPPQSSLWVHAVAGNLMYSFDGRRLLDEMARREHCQRLLAQLDDKRLVRALERLGWKIHKFSGLYIAERAVPNA